MWYYITPKNRKPGDGSNSLRYLKVDLINCKDEIPTARSLIYF